jgi:hypothetical protein
MVVEKIYNRNRETLRQALKSFYPPYDMPGENDLVQLFTPKYYDEGEILIGNTNYLSYNTTCVPYIKINDKLYHCGSSEVVPNYCSNQIANCRKYILCEDTPKEEHIYVL